LEHEKQNTTMMECETDSIIGGEEVWKGKPTGKNPMDDDTKIHL
jgi:hypothetical protein